MKANIGVIVGLALMSLVGVAAARGEDRLDLSKPEVLQKILGEAILRDTLEERGPEGEKLFYAPDSQTPYTGWAKRMHDNGKVKMLWHGNGGKVEGLSTRWHDNGQKAAESTYKDGEREGPYTKWHDNGEKKHEVTYKNGKLEGLATRWDKNGEAVLQAHFKNGKRLLENAPDLDDPEILEEIVGKAAEWDTLKQVGLLYHVEGNPEPYTGWIKKLHDNGKVAALGMLKGGKPDGLWTLWQDDGQKEEEVRYRDGRRITITVD
jgi:antitoxin component YwqK of YwqJK toxin-antitoxin module